MSAADDLRNALQRLREACAEIDRAAQAILAADGERQTADGKQPGSRQTAAQQTGTSNPQTAAGSPQAPADPLLGRLAALQEPFQKAGVDPDDAAFTARAGERLPQLPDDRKALLLADCVRLLDGLLVKYHLLLPAPLREEGIAVQKALAERAGTEPPAGDLRVPDAAPAGTALAPLSAGRRLVSSGRTGPAAAAFLEGVRTGLRTGSADRAAALDDLMKLWPRLADADAAGELTVLRYAINALHPLGTDAVEPLLADLRQRGIAEIGVSVGGLFDDGYGPGRYERRRVPSSAPRNTILSVLQRGFVGPDGAPLQRAVVAVSDGSG
jgi:hypothetical protein